MNKLLFLFYCFLLTGKLINAQTKSDSSSCDYKIVQRVQYFTNHCSYYINGTKVTRAQVNKLLLSYPPSAIEYKKSRLASKRSKYLLFSSLALTASSIPLLNAGHSQEDIGSAFLMAGLIGFTIQLLNYSVAASYYMNSINIYNASLCPM